MQATSLKEIYASINSEAKTIFVVPLIRFNVKKSDYLYLLYKDLIEDSEFDIKSISVFNHFKIVVGLLLNKREAILHYHWLEFQDLRSLAGMPWKILCIYLFHKLGGNIVWTLHNEFPHDRRFLKLHTFLHKKMAQWADILHVHCKTAVEIMSSRLNTSTQKFRLIPHPDFPAFPIPKNKAIQHLNETYNCALEGHSPILLMFGNISGYKQLERVADIVIEEKLDCTLMIVGPVKKGNQNLFEELSEKAGAHKNILLIAKFIPEEHLPWFYSAADLCVFHYREILSSGGYHMAKSYGKKVMAPDKGCLSEEHNRPNVDLFSNENELKDLLSSFLRSFENGR